MTALSDLTGQSSQGLARSLAMDVGKRLKEARQSQGLSLRTLGKSTGFSASFLSQVELGQASPSLASLQRIAGALGLSASALLAVHDEPTSILKKSKRATVRSEWSRATVESLVPGGSDDRLQAVLVRLGRKGRTGTTGYSRGQRLLAYCVSGSAVLVLGEPAEELSVEAGDSVVIDGPRTLAWQSAKTEKAELLVVTVRVK